MSQHELPARPNLEHLKKQARQLQRGFFEADPISIDRFRQVDPALTASTPKLADALHVVAREYGFNDWPALKAHVGSLSEDPAEALKSAIFANDASLVRSVLKRHPALQSRIDEPLPNFEFESPALIGAVRKGSREMVDVLLEAGANINKRTGWWAGSFGVLDVSGPELTPYLIERGAHIDIHAAARLGMFDRVTELVEADPASIHARGGDGQMPLHFAATVEIAEYLLDRGAQIDALDIDHESTAAQWLMGRTPPLMDVVRYLISRGAKTDILMTAAVGDLERTRGHLDANPASVMMSVSEKDLPKQNIHAGGSIYIFIFGWAKTPHMLARQFGHEEVFRLLMERSPTWLRLAQACEVGDDAIAKELLERHPEITRQLPPDALPRIVGAALQNKTQGLRMMLDAGWPANVKGDKDQTPLHWASWHGNAEAVRELIRRGANVNAIEREFGGVPLGWARHGSENSWHRETGDYGATVDALLAAGATIPELRADYPGSEEVLAAFRRFTQSKADAQT